MRIACLGHALMLMGCTWRPGVHSQQQLWRCSSPLLPPSLVGGAIGHSLLCIFAIARDERVCSTRFWIQPTAMMLGTMTEARWGRLAG